LSWYLRSRIACTVIKIWVTKCGGSEWDISSRVWWMEMLGPWGNRGFEVLPGAEGAYSASGVEATWDEIMCWQCIRDWQVTVHSYLLLLLPYLSLQGEISLNFAMSFIQLVGVRELQTWVSASFWWLGGSQPWSQCVKKQSKLIN
jgi:hypothetical protein